MALAAFWATPIAFAIVLFSENHCVKHMKKQMNIVLDCLDGIFKSVSNIKRFKSIICVIRIVEIS